MAEPSYTLRFPFSLQSQHNIAGLQGAVPIALPGLTASLEPESGGYAISITGFSSSTAATEFVQQTWLGLTTMMLDTKAAFSASTDVQAGQAVQVTSPDLPPSFHGAKVVVQERQPYVVPADAPLLKVGTGQPTVSMSNPVSGVVGALVRGMTHPGASRLYGDSRFRTAVDLFAAASFEASEPAKLLTYSISLEVITPVTDKHPVTQSLLDRWRQELLAERDNYSSGSDEYVALDSLDRELCFRREASIRWRVRRYVLATLTSVGAADAPQLAKKAVDAYDRRSKLVHDGSLPATVLGLPIEGLRTVLERLFQARLQLAAV